MNLHIDANGFAPIIEQAVDAAIARILSERVENADGPILSSKAGAVEAMSASASTIDRWRREEGLPFVKLNGLVMFRPEALRERAARKEATATDTAAQTWDGIVATRPTLAELEQHVLTMRVATSMPEYGRDWLEIDDRIYDITGRGPTYQIARDHLHRLYTDRALEASDISEAKER